jgi:hypothetical protein
MPNMSGQLHSHSPVQMLQCQVGKSQICQQPPGCAFTGFICATKKPAISKHNIASLKINLRFVLSILFLL